METLTITVNLTVADWQAFQKAYLKRLQPSVSMGRQWLHISLIALVTFAFLRLVDTAKLSLHPGSVALGAAVLFIAILINARLVRSRLTPDADGVFLGSHIFELDATCLRWRNQHSNSFSTWLSIKELTCTSEHIFLWVDRFQAHMIPTRDLPSGITSEDLCERINRWRTSAVAIAPAHLTDQSPLDSAPSPSLQPATAYKVTGWPTALLELAVLRRRSPLPQTSVTAVIFTFVLLSLTAWIGIDWLRNQPDPEFLTLGLSGVAWYALAVLMLAYVLTTRCIPPIRYSSALILILALTTPAIVATYIIRTYIEGNWLILIASLAVAIYFLAFLQRGTFALTGRQQTAAVTITLFAVIGASWLTEQLYVDTNFWYAGDAESEYATTWENTEPLLFSQPARIDAALDLVSQGNTTATEVFFVGFAGDGGQRVFTKEIKFADSVVAARYHTHDRRVLLLNDERDIDSAPFATTTTLKYTLQGIAARMNLDDDILFLALSSHGSDDWSLSVSNGVLPFSGLSSTNLAAILDETGIKWRIIVISACYAGGFIDALQSPNTIVLAAASPDRKSFGCSDDRDLTSFGEAFYRDALPQAPSIRDAFTTAQTLIATRERRRKIDLQSRPSAYFGKEIEGKLKALETTQL